MAIGATSLKHLPKNLQCKPHIRALGLLIYPLSPRELIVKDPNPPHNQHLITVDNGNLRCDCKRAAYGKQCSHIYRVLALKKEQSMAFEVEVPERQNNGSGKKPAPLPSRDRNRYAGIFAGYSKQYKETFAGETKKMRTFSFLTTHATALGKYMPLEKPVVAKYKAGNKWSYSKTAKSGLAMILEALCGEIEAQRIENLPNDKKGEAIGSALEGAVGKYCTYSAWPNYYVKQGESLERYSGNKIDGKSFVEADERLRKIEAVVAEKLDFSYTQDQQEPRRFLMSPKGAEIDADIPPPTMPPSADDMDLESEVPF